MNAVATKRILIVDDDPGIRLSLRATLEADGCDVFTANDGRAAIEALRCHRFDLAILDLSMPHLDGLQVLKELQAMRQADSTLAVMILTAYGSISAAVDAARYGAADFLHKPISPDALRAAVQRAVLRTTGESPAADRQQDYFS
jgi:DNA-binding response OmpR family regulator